MTTTKTAPCPYCGSAGSELYAVRDYPGENIVAVRCTNCQARGPQARSGKQAVAWWNGRTAK